jgi:hypothetical protein
VTGLALVSTGVVTVSPPAVGSIQYVAATPTSISLRGTGGLGRQETSQVSFRVVDIGGNPLGGRTVTFNLNTTVGGISLSAATATSDPSTGLVVTNVQAGTVSTPVRVTASTIAGAQTLTTQSDQLTITTGIPAQDSFSLAVSTLNIEGWNYDGTTTQITVRMADHFKNPVPDGTAVTFTAEGASIVGSCLTVGGLCSVTFTSQALRPVTGRVTVLAYAVGEEGFTDLNGNGWFDLSPTNELIDSNKQSTDIGEAFVDFNENGVRDATEPFIDFNNNGVFDGPDGKYSGVLCDETVAGRSPAGSCAAAKTLHVRGSHTVVLSGSEPKAELEVAGINNPNPSLLKLTCGSAPVALKFHLEDARGNALPAGTLVEYTTTNGKFASTTSFVIPNSLACRNPGTGNCPASAQELRNTFAGSFLTSIQSDAELPKCENTNKFGTLTLKVTTPKNIVTLFSSLTIED